MPEIGTSGSMSEDEKRSDATWPQRPRSSSTLPNKCRLTCAMPAYIAAGGNLRVEIRLVSADARTST